MHGFLAFLLIVTALFLILLVLIQRGRGGGLAGAFGGLGGQSAFGTKAGDLFTRITIGVAAFWIILCVISVRLMGAKSENKFGDDFGSQSIKTGALTAPGPETKGTGKAETDTGAGEKGAAAPSGDSGKANESSASGRRRRSIGRRSGRWFNRFGRTAQPAESSATPAPATENKSEPAK